MTAHDQLVDDMFALMDELHGVGLAGPQCSVLEPRIAVVGYAGHRLVLLGPIVRAKGHMTNEAIEGCLSLPGQAFLVKRHYSVLVRTFIENDAIDGATWPLDIIAHGFLARIIQHEVDHLNGVLISDIGTEVLDEEPVV